MKASAKTIRAIKADKKIVRGIAKTYPWNKRDEGETKNIEMFCENAFRWIKAIEQRRMLCVVKRVAASGMSRNFLYIESRKNGFNNFYSLLSCLGYTMVDDCIRVSGCGMDMNFATNYYIIHKLCRLGFITDSKCNVLAPMTPSMV